MSSNDIIQGERVSLRPFDESCITDEYLGWLNDGELMLHSKQRLGQHTRVSALAYLSSFRGSPNFFWSLRRRSDGAQFGTLTAYLEPEDGTADIGILVGLPDVRGKGFGREAWGLSMAVLFERQGLRKLTGGTVATNSAMLRIFQHWNMVLEGVRRAQQLQGDCPVDVHLFGLLSEEWTARCRDNLVYQFP